MATVTATRPTASSANLPKRLSLGDFTKGGSGLPPRLLIYGRPSVGKTSVAAYAENPVFILSPGETGLQTLIDAGQLPANCPSQEIEAFEQAAWIVEDLTTTEHSRKTLVIDTINGIERFANVLICNRDFGGDQQKFMSYQNGFASVAMGVWKELLAKLDELRRRRQMQIILLAHTGVKNHKNPGGEDYNRWTPAFEGKQVMEQTVAWCDAVLFADYDVATTEDKQKKVKARGGDRRFFHCTWSAAYEAKNRLGLPEEIEMGDSAADAWKNLQTAIQQGKAQAK